MDTKNQQNDFSNPVVIILVLALIGLGGYTFFSKNSNNGESQNNTIPEKSTENIQNTNLNTEAQTTIKPSTPEATVKNETPKPTQANVITNSQPCLSIANDAAQNRINTGEFITARVKKAYFKKSCIYEITGQLTDGRYITMINYAPGDGIIAYCKSNTSEPFTDGSFPVCKDNSSGAEGTDVFHIIEAQYLAD